MFTAMRNSILLTVVLGDVIVILSAMVGYVLQRRRDRWPASRHDPDARGPRRAARDRAHDLRAAVHRAVQDAARHGPGRGRDPHAVLGPGVPDLRLRHPAGARRGGAHGRREPADPVLQGHPSAAAPGHDHGDRRGVRRRSTTTSSGPLYFLPGSDNATVQADAVPVPSQFSTQWNLLFADVLFITIPPLIMFIFFQRQMVAGMTAGAVKG